MYIMINKLSLYFTDNILSLSSLSLYDGNNLFLVIKTVSILGSMIAW